MAVSLSEVVPVHAVPRVRAKRLLVLSYYFPPDGEVGGLRWSGITKYLGAMGWTSWVVTAAAARAGDSHQIPAGVSVLSCPPRRTLNDWYRAVRSRGGKRVAPSASAPAAPERTISGGKKWLARLRLEAAMLPAVPDQGRGWILRASREARRLIAQVNPDAVVSSGPPHSTHLVAWLATRGTNTRWLIDLRDPWVSGVATAWQGDPVNQSYISRGLRRYLERLTIGAADGVLCTTPELAEVVQASYPKTPVFFVSNGVDRDLLPSGGGDPLPGLALVYAGTIYGAHDLGSVLTALREFLERNPRARAEGTKLRIAGQIDGPHAERLQSQIAALGLEDYVYILGMLPREEALRLVARSGLALVLSQELEHQVPAKLYELVALEVPTVVISSDRSAASSAARRVGARAVEPDDVGSLVEAMEDAWSGRPFSKLGEPAAIDYRTLTSQLVPLLAPS